jgi:hypothetical protein
MLIVMQFDFETKESAECFVGYVSKNENFFSVTKEIQNFCKPSHACTDMGRPREFQEGEGPRIQDNRHMKVVRLSALRTGRLYLLMLLSFRARALVRPEELCQ